MSKKGKIRYDISVTGITTEDLIKGKYNFDDISDKSIRAMTSRLVSAMNKRIVRLGNDPIGKLSLTYQAYEERAKKGKGREGFYSVRGLSRSQSIALFNQLRTSMSKNTSLTTFKSYREDLYKRLNISFENKTFEETYEKEIKEGKYTEAELQKLKEEYKTDEQKFWKVYREYEKEDTANEGYRKGGGSQTIIEYMKNQWDWENMTMIEKINRVNELYEEQKRIEEAKKQALESGYFEESEFEGQNNEDYYELIY